MKITEAQGCELRVGPSPKERPILFKDEMVRAILEGRKTQTRRVVKVEIPPEATEVFYWDDPGLNLNNRKRHGLYCETPRGLVFLCTSPYGQVGDRLWVREAWCQKCDEGWLVYNDEGNLDPSCYWYRADGVQVSKCDPDGFTVYCKDGSEASPWISSIFMPREASRITLEITGVRVERVQDISHGDALAEGVTKIRDACYVVKGFDYDTVGLCHNCPTTAFAKLWDSINTGDKSWAANPWVWVVEFERVET